MIVYFYSIKFHSKSVLCRLETTKLLIHYGADYNAKSRYGDDALQTACLKGASHIFAFLIEEIPYSQEKLANAHELMGATFLDEHSDMRVALHHWRKAIEIRTDAGKKNFHEFSEEKICVFILLQFLNILLGLLPKLPIMKPHEAFKYQREFSSAAELENIATDLDAIRIQSLLIAERILGPYHKDTVFRLMFRGASYADMMRYQYCIDLWRRALEIRVEKDSVLYSDTCFTAQALVRLMINYNDKHRSPHEDIASTNQRFKDVVGTFKLLTDNISEARQLLTIRPVHKRQMDSFDRILKCITHLIYLMLETAKTKEDNEIVTELVVNLVKINPRTASTDDTLLHLCVSRLNTIRSSYFMDEDPVVSCSIINYYLSLSQFYCR